MQSIKSFYSSLFAGLFFFAAISPTLFADEINSEAEGISEVADGALANIGVAGQVEMLPLWELGFGALQLNGKDYPASDRDNDRFFALPYFIYRGEKIRVGDGGVSALAFENSRYSLDFSVAGSVNANSEGNLLRDGLPDIDYMFEVGPQLIVTLYDQFNSDGSRSEMTFATQLRAAFSTDFEGIEPRGGVLSTSLKWERDGIKQGRYGLFAEIAPKWASKELHNVFYEVDPQFETATRPSYKAKGGYLGTDAFIGMTVKPTPKLQFLFGLTHQFFTNAANEDSPLFETDSSNKFFAGLLWEFKSSKTLVPVLRD